MGGRNRRLLSFGLFLALAPFSASAREVWIYTTTRDRTWRSLTMAVDGSS